MEIVVTHDMADFDALAAAVAAQKLYPAARIVLGRRLGREVRSFLALHKDRFPSLRATEIEQSRITRLIVVDVRRRSRLADFSELLERVDRGDVEVCVFDHHPASDDDLTGTLEVVEPVGSATTLLIERIREGGIEIDAVEATLFALGIHADTGSLSYAATTARDAHALAWLIERGADARLIARYLRPPMSAGQRQALGLLLDAAEIEAIAGIDVGFALVELKRTVDGVAEVTMQAADLLGCAALFAVFSARGRVQVVARCRSPLIDAGVIVGALGGGGHASAAAANVKDRDAREVLAELRAALAKNPPRPRLVSDLMSSPVRAMEHDTSLEEVRRLLFARGQTGAPVIRAGALAGMISRRDIERAERDGRLALPVSSAMTHEVVTTTSDTSLDAALAAMETNDIGRLPVLRGGRMIGIITRSDVIRALYRGESAAMGGPPAGR